MSISTATDRNSITISYILLLDSRGSSINVSENIYECYCRVHRQMLLWGHKCLNTWISQNLFRQLLWGYFISGGGNNKWNDFFNSYFQFLSRFSMGLSSRSSENVRKLEERKTAWWILLCCRSQKPRLFWASSCFF